MEKLLISKQELFRKINGNRDNKFHDLKRYNENYLIKFIDREKKNSMFYFIQKFLFNYNFIIFNIFY